MSAPMNHASVVYVPIKGNNKCIYPIYVPVVMKQPDVYKSTGRLSLGDYNESKDNLAGFPALLPLLATIAPLIPPAIKGIKNLIKKKRGNGEIPGTGPSRYNNYFKNQSFGRCGYIPTNPNINNLKQLQSLYDKYD